LPLKRLVLVWEVQLLKVVKAKITAIIFFIRSFLLIMVWRIKELQIKDH
jgi:hypothetical protein